MTIQNNPLAQDESWNQFSEPHEGPQQHFMRVPSGYASWGRWLGGKVLPLFIFTLFLVANSLILPSQVMQLVREGIQSDQVMELLRHLLLLGFLFLLMAAYLSRTHAVDRARGFWERLFPMLVLVVTFAGTSSLEHVKGPYLAEFVWTGLLLTVLGYGVGLWALWHLRGSFAIMAEARSPVTSGPYHYVRHPLYLGESLGMLGLCLAIGTVIAILFWAAWTAMQLTRAYIEETKLAGQFDDYRVYRERTRFILPGLY